MTNRSTRRERVDGASRDVAPGASQTPSGRIYSLGIWWLAIGYCAFYTPYSGLVKATSKGLLPGVGLPASPLEMLPVVGLSTAIVTTLIVTSLGWWRYCGCRTVGGWRLPRPSGGTIVAGVATAAIIYTTTLMFTFTGVSIVLALLIMRGGVLVLAPMLDFAFGRRVRWFAWTGLVFALLAVILNAAGLASFQLDWILAATAGTYLAGYVVRLRCANTLAKSSEREVTCRYFVEEQLVAMTVLVALPVVLALTGGSSIAVHMRHGLTTFLTTSAAVAGHPHRSALRRPLLLRHARLPRSPGEHVLCRAQSRREPAGRRVRRVYVLAALVGERLPNAYELAGAALILCAIVVLSPMHHALETLSVRSMLAYRPRLPRAPVASAGPPPVEPIPVPKAAAAPPPVTTDPVATPLVAARARAAPLVRGTGWR